MNIAVVNSANGRMTMYSPAELRRDARAACKGKGKLETFWVCFREGADNGHGATLVVQYKQIDGWCGSTNVAI